MSSGNEEKGTEEEEKGRQREPGELDQTGRCANGTRTTKGSTIRDRPLGAVRTQKASS